LSTKRVQGAVRRSIHLVIVTAATTYCYHILAALLIAVVIPLGAGWHSTTIMSGSMEPALSPGDVLALADYDGSRIEPGTIIEFENQALHGATVTHRIVSINSDGSYMTKGDANQAADSTPVAAQSILGVARLVSPNVGLPHYWRASGQFGWLAGWIVTTVGALTMTTTFGRRDHLRHWRWLLRPVIAVGVVAALVGMGTAAWSTAAFTSSTSSPASQFAAGSSFATVAHEGSLGTAACATGTASSLTLAQSVPAGSTLIIRFALRDRQTDASFGAVDSAGNEYTVDAAVANGSRTQAAILSGYIDTALAAGDQITVSHPEGKAVVVRFDEFSGIAADGRVSASGTSTGRSKNPSATAVIPDDGTLVVGFVSIKKNDTSYTQPTGWVPLDGGQTVCEKKVVSGGGWLESALAGSVAYEPVLGTRSHWAETVVAYNSA